MMEILDLILRILGISLGVLGLASLLRFYLNFYESLGRKNEDDQRARQEIRRLKIEYERRLRQLHERAKMYEALHNALSRNKLIIRCAEHPNSPITILPDGTILCQEGQHRIWPEEEVIEE